MTGPTESLALQRRDELDRLHRRVRVRRYRSLLLHWLGRWLRPPARASFAPVPRPGPGQIAITFGGHATALIRYPELAIAFDPMLGRWCGAVRRAVEPGLAPGDLDDVGLVLISHAHRDHLHLPTLARLPRAATVVVPQGAGRFLSSLGFARVIEVVPGADFELRGVTISTSPLNHGDAPLARGLCYLVRGSGPSVFLCGDGGWFSGFADVGARHEPDIALLPIGGFWPRSFRDRHMSPLDALYAFEDLRARLLIPIHHGAFTMSYERVDEPLRWLRALVADRGLDAHVRILAPGESEVFVAPRGAEVRRPALRLDSEGVGEPADGAGDGTVVERVRGDHARSVDIILDDSAPVVLGAPPVFAALPSL
ncbi:MAG: MBL fold metallo-hydrolase [Kofleriaceae bacterium]|nr:MBL fold metallo-hydrolase [Myxococcales bacterium]MCB9565046.1 MBL fold metallo-hydrolase [Kofleriaceae bacterium]MCB9573783.1 MBL fold metallo-hydrolase [Kofleriaceae bacterium]